jgi:phage anti-repressor protein
MHNYTTINEYNTYLVENQIQINIIDFVKEVNKIKYNIDISFIDEFIELVSKDNCCIHHNMLEKYGICNIKGGSKDIKRILEQNEFIENEDYLLSKVAEQLLSGTKYKNEYYLHPESFKICLMRSQKTRRYAKYYLLLEKCIKYYNDYQIELNKKYIIKLKNKIVDKDDKIDERNLKIDEQNSKIDELLKLSKKSNRNDRKMKQQLEDITLNLDDIKEELTESNTKLNYACKKLDIAVEDRVPKTDNHDKLEDFILLKSKNKKALYKYYAICGQSTYVDRKSNKKIDKENYTKIKFTSDGLEEISRIDNVANSKNLWHRLKEKLKKKVEYCGNEMNLIDITEEELWNTIKLVYDKRKEVIIDVDNIIDSDCNSDSD